MYDLWLLQRQAMGKNGHRIVKATDGSVTLNRCIAIIHAVTDIVIADYTASLSTGTLVGQTIKAGDSFWGNFYGTFQLTTGTAILYYA